MSRIRDAAIKNMKFHIEEFDSSMEVAKVCSVRKRTDSNFHDMPNHSIHDDWHGVSSYEEAMELMKTGYQPTVDKLKSSLKIKSGEGTRFSFKNNVVGFAPVVPLALKNVPNCMIGMTMKPIKAKIVNVYYDITAHAGVGSSEIIEAGQKLLGAVVELERQGYRFNLYAIQGYSDSSSCDLMVVRVKRDSQPLDLKRVSFPLTHTAFFRVIGFDWYSKVPNGKYRGGYGQTLIYHLNDKQIEEMTNTLFGKNSIYVSASKIIKNKNDIKEVLIDGNSKD